MKQHRKDVEYERIDYNAIARHVKEEEHNKLRERKVKTFTRN